MPWFSFPWSTQEMLFYKDRNKKNKKSAAMLEWTCWINLGLIVNYDWCWSQKCAHAYVCVWEFLLPVQNSLPALNDPTHTLSYVFGVFLFRNWSRFLKSWSCFFYLFQLTANITDDFFGKHFYKAKNAPCNQEIFFLENVSLYKMNNIVRISQLPSLGAPVLRKCFKMLWLFLFICLHTLYIWMCERLSEPVIFHPSPTYLCVSA